VYSYDVTSAFRQTTATRGIPAMRPSYDAEHPSAPTPIYDELYSEYRRLFRALPGDRSGEEDLRFTGFAVRERPYAGTLDEYRRPYGGEQYGGAAAALAQHQSFPTYAGQLPGAPQFVPAQQHPNSSYQHPQQASQHPGQAHEHQPQHLPHQHQHQHQHPQQSQPAQQAQQAQQPSTGQGWVASGYLAPVTVPAPGAPGRHRGNLLSLPPGRD
jgi:hypothetical protein